MSSADILRLIPVGAAAGVTAPLRRNEGHPRSLVHIPRPHWFVGRLNSGASAHDGVPGWGGRFNVASPGLEAKLPADMPASLRARRNLLDRFRTMMAAKKPSGTQDDEYAVKAAIVEAWSDRRAPGRSKSSSSSRARCTAAPRSTSCALEWSRRGQNGSSSTSSVPEPLSGPQCRKSRQVSPQFRRRVTMPNPGPPSRSTPPA